MRHSSPWLTRKMHLIGEQGNPRQQSRQAAFPRLFIRQHLKHMSVQEIGIKEPLRIDISSQPSWFDEYDFKRENFRLRLQHPRQHLSAPKPCSRSEQQRELRGKNRAGRPATQTLMRRWFSSERTTTICKSELEIGQLPISSTVVKGVRTWHPFCRRRL